MRQADVDGGTPKYGATMSRDGENLYDCDGNLVGKWYGERGMLADCFVVRERTCHVVNEADTFGDRTEIHDCCGDTHIRDMFTGRAYPYCPNCGARVVDE